MIVRKLKEEDVWVEVMESYVSVRKEVRTGRIICEENDSDHNMEGDIVDLEDYGKSFMFSVDLEKAFDRVPRQCWNG